MPNEMRERLRIAGLADGIDYAITQKFDEHHLMCTLRSMAIIMAVAVDFEIQFKTVHAY